MDTLAEDVAGFDEHVGVVLDALVEDVDGLNEHVGKMDLGALAEDVSGVDEHMEVLSNALVEDVRSLFFGTRLGGIRSESITEIAATATDLVISDRDSVDDINGFADRAVTCVSSSACSSSPAPMPCRRTVATFVATRCKSEAGGLW